MDEKMKRQKFLQLQFGMLLVVCTLLPDFGSLLGIPDFDIAAFCSQLVGIILGGVALYSFYKVMGTTLSMSFWILAGGGLLLAL